MSRKKIKAAVVGVGYLGRLHAQKYALLEGAEFVGVFDANPARAAEVAAEFGTKAFHDVNELFGKVDAVSIVTPTEHHYRLGMEFLSRGVHVMMEKPITTTTDEARSLVAEAKRTGAVLQVGHLERFNGAMIALGNRIKDPVFIEAFRLSPFPNRSTDVDVILDLMIHDLDLVLSMAGSEPDSVEATGMPVVSTRHNGIPEGVLDGVSAFLVPERDHRRLAEKIEYLIERPSSWPVMGEAGRKFVEGKYDIRKLNCELVSIYEQMLRE
jgi:predicted dehydrogenase